MKDFLKTLNLIFKYNYFKIIMICGIYFFCIVFNNSEPNIYEKEIKDVITLKDYKGTPTYYITSYGSEIESIQHKSIDKELNGDLKLEKGDRFKYYSTSGWAVVSIIFITIFTLSFIISLFDQYGDWKGFKIKDIKTELFMDKVDIIRGDDGRNLYVYKGRIFYASMYHRELISNSRLYSTYKSSNFNDLSIYVDPSITTSDNKPKELNTKEDKLKEIMKLIDDYENKN